MPSIEMSRAKSPSRAAVPWHIFFISFTEPELPETRMIRKLKSGEYRLYSRKIDPKSGKRRNLGTFASLAAAKQHEREVQYFKRRS